MQQQQPNSILWQRLALRARSRRALRAMLAARILGPKCRASAEESAFDETEHVVSCVAEVNPQIHARGN